MRRLNFIKRALTASLGLTLTFPVGAQAQETKEVEPAKAKFTKEDLIASLKGMNRNPRGIKTVCAMCYEIALPSPEVEFRCDKCGQATIYSRSSDEGALVNNLPYIKRSFRTMPYEISIDATGLCPVCGKGKPKILIMEMSCFNCGKHFNWEAKTYNDVNLLRWLYLKPPIKEIDTHYLGWEDDPSKIKEGAAYIRDHVFCPECRSKMDLNK